MRGMAEIKSAVRHYLSNHLVSAEVVSQTMGLFTKPIRKTNVVMFHIGRCGSTVVGTLLNQHPRIRWGGEVFASLKRKYGKDSWVWEDPLRMIRLRTNIHICRVFGIEIKKKHFGDVKMKESKIIDRLEKIGYKKYVILKRENYLKREVSKIVGDVMENWNVEEEVDPPKVEIPILNGDGKAIIHRFKEIDNFYNSLEKQINEKEYIKISYERDIKEEPKKAFNKITRWVGLKSVNTKVRTKKINKRPLGERISNFDEVKKVLDKTEYEWMVHDT
jgi:hypothetical protein